MKLLLEHRVAVVTGAAPGVGRATAALFGREGARVVLADSDEGELEGVAAQPLFTTSIGLTIGGGRVAT